MSDPRPGPPQSRTCPSCRMRHYVPRRLPNAPTMPPLIALDRYQLKGLYAMAQEFIEAGGGEDVAADEVCEACGRWSVIAFLDWVAADVAKDAA